MKEVLFKIRKTCFDTPMGLVNCYAVMRKINGIYQFDKEFNSLIEAKRYIEECLKRL